MRRIFVLFVLMAASTLSLTYAQQENAVSSSPVVVLETTQGNIELKFTSKDTPKTVENFVGLVNKGYYNGIIFHRVIKGFMIQGGDPTGTGRGGESLWGGKFDNELNKSIKFDHKGVLAMANAGLNTNGSQFFITTAATPWLTPEAYTIFGEVSSGYEAVEKIENAPTAAADRPVEDQKIIKAYVK